MRTDKWVFALSHLNLNDQDFGPTCHGTYVELSTGWRGDKPLPSEVDLEAASEIAVDQIAWASLRTERDSLLVSNDWTQYNDSPLTDEVKTSWATYRQELRDLPANTPDPANPTWPDAPE